MDDLAVLITFIMVRSVLCCAFADCPSETRRNERFSSGIVGLATGFQESIRNVPGIRGLRA